MTTTEAPTVEAVLQAVDRAALLPLLPDHQQRLLVGPVARAAAGVVFDGETRASVTRMVLANAGVLAGPLSQLGVGLPEQPSPQPRKPSHSSHVHEVPVVHIRGDGRIALRSTPYALKELCRALPGAKWGGQPKCWSVPATPAGAAAVMEALAPYAPKVSAGVTELAQRYVETEQARGVLVDGAPLPEGDGTDVVTMPLWDHQRRAVAFGVVADALLLAMPMGSGKTGAAIAVVNRVQAATVLIVAPNRVRAVWTREVREKSALGWHIEDGTRPARQRGRRRQDLSAPDRLERCQRVLWDCPCDAPVHAFVINYEQLGQPVWQDWVPPQVIDFVIYDEIHRLKSERTYTTSKRKSVVAGRRRKTWSRVAGDLVPFSRRRLGLSGTPLPQRALDAFGVFRALDPGIFGEVWTRFKDRYAVMDPTGTFPLPTRVNHGAELARKFMSITYLPVVDLKLPAEHDVRREVELEPEAAALYKELDERFWADLSVQVARQAGMVAGVEVEAGEPAEVSTDNILTRLLRLQQLTGGTSRTDPVRDADGRVVAPGKWVRVSTAKAEVLADVLDEIGCVAGRPGGVEPVVVFCRFRSDLDAVAEVAAVAGLRYAELSGRRVDAVDDGARMSTECDVAGVQIQAGGTGIDLTRARYVVFYSCGYSLADYEQARKRVHRPGQTRPVTYVHLIAEGTKDLAVYTAMQARQSAITAVLLSGGVDPRAVGVREIVPRKVVVEGVEVDSSRAAVRLPWD